jgi:hypothetical protein
MIGLAAAPAPVLAIAELRQRGWRFVEVVAPFAPPGIPDAMRRLLRGRHGAWLAIPPERVEYPEQAQRFDSRPAALRWATGVEATAAS